MLKEAHLMDRCEFLKSCQVSLLEMEPITDTKRSMSQTNFLPVSLGLYHMLPSHILRVGSPDS